MLFGHLWSSDLHTLIINRIYKTIYWVDSSLLFVCWTVPVSPRTKECLWEIAANSAAVFSSVTQEKGSFILPPQSPYPKNKMQSSGLQVRNAPKHYMHPTLVKASKWLHVSLVERMIELSFESRFHPLIHLVSNACQCLKLDGIECKAAIWHFKHIKVRFGISLLPCW